MPESYHSTMALTATKSLAHELLEVAESEIDDGELIKAAGTLWRAAAEAFELVAKARGWEIDPSLRHYDVYARLRTEVDRDTLINGITAASLMRQNQLEDYHLHRDWATLSASDIRSLIDALQVAT